MVKQYTGYGRTPGSGIYALAGVLNAFRAEIRECRELTAEILLPEDMDMAVLYEMKKQLARMAEQFSSIEEISITGRKSSLVRQPLFCMAGSSEKPAAADRAAGQVPEQPAVHPGMDIVMTGYAGLETMLRALDERKAELRQKLPASFLNSAEVFRPQIFLSPAADPQAADCRAAYQAALGTGGIFAGLWQLAQAAKTGFRADLRRIPIRQETIEILEVLQMNPYTAASGGSRLLIIADGETYVEKMNKIGIFAEIIGKTTPNNDKIVFSRDEERYLERPSGDETEKMFTA